MSIRTDLFRRWSRFITGTSDRNAATTATVADLFTPNANDAALAADPWPLSRTLIHFRTINLQGQKTSEPFSLRDAYEGIFVTGGPGSGKSSGSGKHLAHALLRAGAGGLVLSAKRDEAAAWREYARECGREDDLVIFSEREEEGSGFNFLDYEMAAGKGNPAEAATNVMMEIGEGVSGGPMGGGDSQIWIRHAKTLIRNVLSVCLLANESVSIAQVARVATSDKAADAMLAKAQARADAGELTASQIADLEAVRHYLAVKWRELDERPKSSVLMTADTVGDTFSVGVMRDLFTGKTTITPDAILKGKIVVVDLSVAEYGEAGKAANILWKYCLQKAIQRRGGIKPTDRPTFIFADECQYFVTKRDAEFVTTSRSAGCCNIYLTQNRPTLIDRLGESTADGFLGCFTTKVFHQNADGKTNEWAADSIAKILQTRTSTSTNYNVGSGPGGPGGGGGTSQQQVMDHEVMPRAFQELSRGGEGEREKYVVTALLFRSGHIFTSNGKTYIEVAFNQIETRL